MFNDSLSPRYTWRNKGKAKQNPDVKTGVYVLEHRPTGKLYVGVDSHVTMATTKAVTRLEKGNFNNRAFQGSASVECDILIYEYPTSTLAAAKRLERDILESISPNYLLTNPSANVKESKRKKVAL